MQLRDDDDDDGEENDEEESVDNSGQFDPLFTAAVRVHSGAAGGPPRGSGSSAGHHLRTVSSSRLRRCRFVISDRRV